MYDKEEINIVFSVLQAPRQSKEITESNQYMQDVEEEINYI